MPLSGPVIAAEDRMSGRATVLATLVRTVMVAATPATVWTPGSGKRIDLRYLHLTSSGATVLTIKIGALLISEHDCTANWPIDSLEIPEDVILQGAVDALLTVTSSNAVTVGVSAAGFES